MKLDNSLLSIYATKRISVKKKLVKDFAKYTDESMVV